MNWFQGNIAEAVAQSKVKNAIFVVFVEGPTETTQNLKDIIDSEEIRAKLQSDDFVAIKIESTSTSYTQFASIYKLVPVPSLFFIGKSGAPLEIATSIISTVDELDQKIKNVLLAAGKVTEQVVEQSQPSTSKAAVVKNSPDTDEIVCEGGVCYKKPINSTAPEDSQAETTKAAETVDATNARLEETRKLLEQQRRERVQQEKKLENERELRRRREGKDIQNVQQWQREEELNELKKNIRREKLEEQALRDRIKAQIAGDRAERAQKIATEAEIVSASAAVTRNEVPVSSADSTRLQFRFANGAMHTKTFKCIDHLSVVREYVLRELIPGTDIGDDFTLATIYPKRELSAENESQTLRELELFPSAVLLVIGKIRTTPATLIMRYGGIVNIMNTVFMALLSPVFAIFNFLKDFKHRRFNAADPSTIGAQKRSNENQGAQQDAAKRRNMDQFMGPSTSKDAENATPSAGNAGNNEQLPYRRYGSSNVHRLGDNRKDSDDENATWNGNSTQQQ